MTPWSCFGGGTNCSALPEHAFLESLMHLLLLDRPVTALYILHAVIPQQLG